MSDLQKMGLKLRSDIHWQRKVWHITTVSGMAALYAYLPISYSVSLMLLATFTLIPADYLRLKSPPLNRQLMQIFGPIMRDSETHKMAGTSYLIAGVCLVVCFFSRNVTLLTLLFLAYADPIASYFGILYGKDKIFGHKSLQGFIAAFFVCTLISFLFFYYNELLLDRLIFVGLIAGLIGALAELLPVFKLDDNLTLPLISATALWGMFNLFGVS